VAAVGFHVQAVQVGQRVFQGAPIFDAPAALKLLRLSGHHRCFRMLESLPDISQRWKGLFANA
jgi:hypothetical protein